MKVISVQYTTTAQFAPINQANIAAIVKEVKALNHPGIKYGCWLLPDGKTFMHFDQFENDEAHDVLTSLPSFKKFDAELWASGLEIEPILELPVLVASTESFFDMYRFVIQGDSEESSAPEKRQCRSKKKFHHV